MNPREKNFLMTALVVAAAFISLGLVQAKGPSIEKLQASPAQNSNPWLSWNSKSVEMCLINADGSLSRNLLKLAGEAPGQAASFCEAMMGEDTTR